MKLQRTHNGERKKNRAWAANLFFALSLLLAPVASIFGQWEDDFGGDTMAEPAATAPTGIPNVDLVDTPTANTIGRGNYQFSFTGYNEGGILSKGIVGLADQIYMGVSFDVSRAIGHRKPEVNIPGAIAKIKVYEGQSAAPMKLAVGYDSFYAGKSGRHQNIHNPFNQVIYGPYAVMSRPIWMFGQQQYFHMGVRTPLQPYYNSADTSLFAGVEVPLNQFFILAEVERVYFDSNRLRDALVNVGFRYVLFEKMALELNFMMGYNITANRMLVFEYTDRF